MTKFVNSRDFNQDISAAKRATAEGPVVITDRGTPAYVLLKHEDYVAGRQRLGILLPLHARVATADAMNQNHARALTSGFVIETFDTGSVDECTGGHAGNSRCRNGFGRVWCVS